ncbi:MAG: DegQ family serine endoprotease [Acidobacteriota bacterium]
MSETTSTPRRVWGRRRVAVAAGALASLAASALLVGGSRHGVALAQGKALEGSDIDLLEKMNRGFVRIAQSVTPAIVNIQTTQVIKIEESPFFNDPFFRQFFGDMFHPYEIPREQREHALGSGVIVSPDGYVVTNNHVIAHANEITVMLPDRRTFKGKVVGADPQTDVAVLKLAASGLPAIGWGDSSTVQPGEVVMAFGNPFGLSFTVTRGIVSAVGRSGLGIESYEDFIQTDAAINPGNSGGALVNVRGQIVGINTAILSANTGPDGEGGSNGVGFAIPSNVVKRVMDSLIKTGKVERGYLGAAATDLSETMARKLKVPDVAGAVVKAVASGSPAARAGLQAGDVIRTLDGKPIDSKDALDFQVASRPPGEKISVGILRDGSPITIDVTLEAQPTRASAGVRRRAVRAGTLRGITVQALTPRLRDQLGLPADLKGVVISSLDPASPAGQEGLQPGDVIIDIDRRPVTSVADFERLAAGAAGEVLVRIVRDDSVMFVVVTPLDEQSS